MDIYQRFKISFLSNIEHRNENELYSALENKQREVCTVPCSKINAFFRTWLIYSCKGRSCPYTSKKCKLDGNKIPNSVSPTEFAFYTFLGIDYTNNSIRNIIRRLNRFVHIIKYEDGEFNSAFKEFVDDNRNTFRPVLSRENDKLKIIISYQNIFDYMKLHIDDFYDTLIENFNNIINNIDIEFNRLDKNKASVIEYISKDIFFSGNQEINDLREKALVLVYILIYRFYEILNIDIISGNSVPEASYVNKFFYPEKVFISNDIIYIILKDRKSILVYDILGKIKNLSKNDIFEDKLFLTINNLRKIYLYRFEKEITSVYSDVYNTIFEFKDHSFKINGSNFNNKIDSKENPEYFFFKDFETGDFSKIVKTKISKHFIIQLKENGTIYIHGNIVDNKYFTNENTVETENNGIRQFLDDQENPIKYFYLSENEKYFLIDKDHEICKTLIDDFGNKYTFEDNVLKIEDIENNIELITITPKNDNQIVRVHKIIPIRNNSFILECEETDGEKKNYRYFIYGDNTDSRLGYKFEENEPKKLFEITDDICIDRKGNIDRNIRINKILSYTKRIIILNSNNVVLAAGRNSGYFCDIPNSSNENFILEKYTKIVNNEDIDPIFDIVSNNDHNEKPILLIHNKHRVYCFGSISYRGFKNGGGYIEENEVVESKNNNESIYKTLSSSLSLFCTQRCIYSQNVIFDVLAYNLSRITSNTSVDYFDYNRLKDTILYLKEISVKENMYDAFDIKLNNFSNTSDIVRDLNRKTISGKLSNLKSQDLSNYLTSRYMIEDFSEDKEYSYFGIFLNYLVMMIECKKYVKLEEVNERGNLSSLQFEENLNDINKELPFDKEDRINGYIN